MHFERHPLAKERKSSSIVLVKALLQEHSGLLDNHRQEFVRLALWKVTEAEGIHKLRTKFMSEAALSVVKSEPRPSRNTELRHEHVFERAKMADVLIHARPESVDDIIKNAIGCTVTKDEHDRLGLVKDCDGWKRYREAGIPVWDTEKNLLVNYDVL
jgi:hypothetical protein